MSSVSSLPILFDMKWECDIPTKEVIDKNKELLTKWPFLERKNIYTGEGYEGEECFYSTEWNSWDRTGWEGIWKTNKRGYKVVEEYEVYKEIRQFGGFFNLILLRFSLHHPSHLHHHRCLCYLHKHKVDLSKHRSLLLQLLQGLSIRKHTLQSQNQNLQM